MNNLPRRSARLSHVYQNQSSQASLSSTSQSTSASPSFPSPADEDTQHDPIQSQTHAQFLAAPAQFSVPLPSPSAHEYSPFFAQTQTQQNFFSMPQQSQQSSQQSHQQHNRSGSDKSHQNAAEHHNSFSSQHKPALQTGGNPGQLPPDFLAEAARRAQIACLMRDMGDVTL